MRHILTAILALSLSATPAAGALDLRLPDIGDPASRTLSPSDEGELGRQIMRELRGQVPLVEDPEVQAYIDDLAVRLGSYSDRPGFPFDLFVVDSPAINAFALPGGHIGVNSGLIVAAESESELAAVIAHEMAHVTQRHLARRMAMANRLNVRSVALLLAGLLIGSQNAEAGQAAIMAGTAGSVQEQLNYSRTHEQEADRVGLRLLADAGYDPQGMPAFFERLMESSRFASHPPEYLSTHPMTQSRIADTAARADRLAATARESSSFALIRNKLIAQSGDSDRAIRHFRAELQSDGGAEARYGLALALAAAGDKTAAVTELARISGPLAEHPSVMLARARIEQQAGNTAESRRLYREALALFPDNTAIQLAYARFLLDTGEARQAYAQLTRQVRGSAEPELQRLYAQAAGAAGHTAEAKLAMAEFYSLRGEWRAALSQLDQVLQSAATPHQTARASARKREVQQALQESMRER